MPAKYLSRLQQAAEALQILTLHADGLSIEALSGLLGIDEFDTRQNLAAYHESQFLEDEYRSTASPLLLADAIPDPTWEGLSRADWFDRHWAPDLQSAVWVALDRDLSRSDAFGVLLDVAQIVDLLNCADNLLAQEPDNEALRNAVATLQVRWVPDMTLAGQTFRPSPVLPVIRRALIEHRRLRFQYSREWQPGTSVRVVEPYELKQTRLGYELDAGPVADNGQIRTYLVANMSEVTALDETFADPPDKRALIDRNRRTLTATIVIPKSVPRAYESLAADVRRIDGHSQADEDWVVEAVLQQPFDERLGLFMMRAGPDAFLTGAHAPMSADGLAHYQGARARLARTLLTHHGLDSPDRGFPTAGQTDGTS